MPTTKHSPRAARLDTILARACRQLQAAILTDLQAEPNPLHELLADCRYQLAASLSPEDFARGLALVTACLAEANRAGQSPSHELWQACLMECREDHNPLVAFAAKLDNWEQGMTCLQFGSAWREFTALLASNQRPAAAANTDALSPAYLLPEVLQKLEPQRRRQLGAFYTPRSVIDYILGDIEKQLQSLAGFQGGWNDWLQAALPTNKEAATVFDPAMGTGLFFDALLERLQQVWSQESKRCDLDSQSQQRQWNHLVDEHILPRLVGFEIDLPAFCLAEVFLRYKLRQTGYTGAFSDRRLYLADSLLSADELLAEPGAAVAMTLAAAEFKRHVRSLVVLGNPPYSNFATQRESAAWTDLLVQDYKPNGERKTNLSELSIRFLRLGQELVVRNGQGILSYVTNSTFLAGVTHGGVRGHLAETFDTIDVLETQNDEDEFGNEHRLFGIKQNTCVITLSRHTSRTNLPRISHASLSGQLADKHRQLERRVLEWQDIPSDDWAAGLGERFDTQATQEWNQGIALNDVWSEFVSGVQTKCDALFVDRCFDALASRMQRVLNADSEQEEEFDVPAWLRNRLPQASFAADKIQPYLLAPGDKRFVYYDPQLLGRARFATLRHMLADNVGMVFMRQNSNPEYDHSWVTKSLIGDRCFYSRNGTPYLAPLYLYDFRGSGDHGASAGGFDPEAGTTANFAPEFVARFFSNLEIDFRGTAASAESHANAQDVLGYLYALVNSTSYRSRYRLHLAKSFPRVFVPANTSLFWRLAGLGTELIELHTNGSCENASSEYGLRVELQDSTPGRLTKLPRTLEDESLPRSSLNLPPVGRIHGMDTKDWHWRVGGYQVAYKYLQAIRDSRAHWTANDVDRLAAILLCSRRTQSLAAEIDDTIQRHGGWGVAFRWEEEMSSS